MVVPCRFCGKMLSSQRGLNRHLQRCRPVKRTRYSNDASPIPSSVEFVNGSANALDDPAPFSTSMEDYFSENSSVSDNHCSDFTDTAATCMFNINNSLLKKTIFRSPREQIEIKLLNFCEKINAPLYAYDELMTILSDCEITQDTFNHDFTRRANLLKRMKEQFHMTDTEPRKKTVSLESGNKITVMTCPFLPMLESLLNDPRCVSDDNLTFQNNDPLSVPIETGIRDELHSGKWYQKTWLDKCNEPGDSLLVIYLFIDKTFTDVYGRLNFEPVQFTLSIFNRKTRNQFHAWRPLGYVTDLKTVPNGNSEGIISRQEDDMPKLKVSEVNIRDYHKVLSVILEDFKIVQETGKIRYNLNYKNKLFKINFIPILGPIIGDTSGHDMLVGRYSGRTNVTRICRYCDCHYHNSDNPNLIYEYTKASDIKNLYIEGDRESKNSLNNISYHYVKNVFHSIECGSDPRGINGLCPVEILHCMRLGILKIAVECFTELLPPAHVDKLDKLMSKMSDQFRHQSYRCVPKTSFTGSIMNLKRKTADEWTGIVLLIVASLHTIAGKYFWRRTGMADSVKNSYIKIFEKCLILEKWLQKEDGYELSKMELAQNNIIEFMREYKSTCSRQVGNNMKLVKFHMLLHIIDDIDRLGSPQNTNGAPCESNFKPQKKESVRTQRRAKFFHEQIALRIHDQMVISRATQLKTKQINVQQDRLVGGSKFIIKYDPMSMEYDVVWKRAVPKKRNYDKRILKFVYNIFFDHDFDHEIQCFTEHRINGEIFHGDCSYRGDHEWYDWVNILWDSTDNENGTQPILGKIHMFVDCRKHRILPPISINGLDITGEEIYTVISSLNWKVPKLIGVSTLFLKGQLDISDEEITLFIVPVSAINSTAFAFHDIQEKTMCTLEKQCIIMTPTEEWGNKYYDLYKNTI